MMMKIHKREAKNLQTTICNKEIRKVQKILEKS